MERNKYLLSGIFICMSLSPILVVIVVVLLLQFMTLQLCSYLQVVIGTVYDHETLHMCLVHHFHYHGNITCSLPIATSLK